MELLKLAIAQLRAKPFNTFLSIIMFTIGMSIIGILMHFENSAQKRIEQDIAGIDLVVGAKGSPLQLILSSVFHADYPTGNISISDAEKIEKHPLVKNTIPIALGDNFKGYRIIGTNKDYANTYNAHLGEGKWNKQVMEVVIGSKVASQTGLKPGDKFTGVHGFMEHGHAHDQHPYLVTGILNENNSVIDRLILTQVESVWDVHNHNKHCEHDHADGHEHCDHCSHNHSTPTIENVLEKVADNEELSAEEMHLYNDHKGQLSEHKHDTDEQITSLLVFFNNPMATTTLPGIINQNTVMQAASPAIELNRLMTLLGVGFTTLRILAWLIIAFSAINLLVHMLNRLNLELFELALLRSLGVSRFKSLLLLLVQGALLASIGWIFSIITTRVMLVIISAFNTDMGISLSNSILTSEIYLLFYAIAIGCLSALIPAVKAYNTNIHYLLNKL